MNQSARTRRRRCQREYEKLLQGINCEETVIAREQVQDLTSACHGVPILVAPVQDLDTGTLEPSGLTDPDSIHVIIMKNASDKLDINMARPGNDSNLHAMTILTETDSYQDALRKRANAMNQTDCESQSESVRPQSKKRRIVKPMRYFSEFSSDSESGMSAVPPPSSTTAESDTFMSSRRNDSEPLLMSTPRANHQEQVRSYNSGFSLPGSPVITVQQSSQDMTQICSCNGLLKKLLKQSVNLKENIKMLTEITSETLKCVRYINSQYRPSALKDLSDLFPINSRDDLRKVEQEFESDTQLFDSTVETLKDMGGSTTARFIQRAMPKIVTNTFAGQCNVTGGGTLGKLGIKSTVIFKILLAAGKLNMPTREECNQEKLEGVLRCWFNNSRDRRGGARTVKRKLAVLNSESTAT